MKSLLLAGILLIALAGRLIGLDFGLPNRDHAYPYNPDEWTPMGVLHRMDPGRLDFNPHYFDNPTFQYYLYGAAIYAAHLAGVLRADGGERFYFEHPGQVARMILTGRLFSLLAGVLSVWLLYLLGRRLGLDRATSRLAALILALYPSHMIHSRFMTVNAPVTFWILVTFLGLERWLRRGGVSSLLMVGGAAGLALSTKFSAALLLPVIAATGILRARGVPGREPGAASAPSAGATARETLAALAVTIAVFLAGSPYLVLAFGEFSGRMTGFMLPIFTRTTGGGDLAGSLAAVGMMYVHASTPPLLLAALAGVVLFARRLTLPRIPAMLWIAGFLLVSTRAGHLASDSRVLPLFPFFSLMAAVALMALIRRSRPAGIAALAIVFVPLLAWDMALTARFLGPQPQQLASQWCRENLRGPLTVCMAGSASFYHPDLPYREFVAKDNAGNYERETEWVFLPPGTYEENRPANPDAVILSLWVTHSTEGMAWLSDPAYEVAAHFPGKVRLFGRRVLTPLDFFDVDIWIMRRRDGPP